MLRNRASRIDLACALYAVVFSTTAIAQSGGVAYVSNQQGAVSVIDLGTMAITSTLQIAAKGPRGIGLTADGKWLVTANMSDGNISVVDTATGALLRQVLIGKNPEFVRVLGQTAYVTYEPNAAPVATSTLPAADSKGDDDKVPGHIAVVDLKSGAMLHDIVGKPETEGLEFSRSGKELIVTNESDDSLGVYEVSSGTLLKTISVAKYGHRPRGIKASPDGSLYVTTLEMSNKMLVWNDRFELLKEIDTGKAPYGVAFNRRGDRVFVAASKEKALQVFDARTWSKIKDIPTGDRCWHFSFSSDDQHILLACGKSNEVLVIDANTLEVIKHIDNMKAPWGIVAFPASMGSIN
jgi:YVTN family beta-propeller protein